MRIKSIIKDGRNSIYVAGDIVDVTSTKGFILKGDDGNYYRQTLEIIDGIPTVKMSDSLGTSV